MNTPGGAQRLAQIARGSTHRFVQWTVKTTCDLWRLDRPISELPVFLTTPIKPLTRPFGVLR